MDPSTDTSTDTKRRILDVSNPNYIETLPMEIILHILTFVDLKTLPILPLICKQWRSISVDPLLRKMLDLSTVPYENEKMKKNNINPIISTSVREFGIYISGIETPKIHYHNISSTSIKEIYLNCPYLTYLNISVKSHDEKYRNNKLTSTSLITLSEKCNKLRYLNLSNVAVAVQTLNIMIPNLPDLECLILEESGISDYYDATNIAFNSLGHYCNKLRILNIKDLMGIEDNIESVLLSVFSKCTDLQQLYITGGLSSSLLQVMVTGCLKLTHLRFGDSNLVNRDLALISKHYPMLQLFSIKSDEINESSIRELVTRCHHLTYINVGFCRNIDDSCVVHIAENCKELRFLEVNYTRVTEQIVNILGKCKKLKFLGETFSSTSNTKRDEKRKAIIDIIFEGKKPNWDKF